MPLSDRHRRKDLSAGGFFGRSLSVFGAALPQFFVLGLLILSPLAVLDAKNLSNPLAEDEVDLRRSAIEFLAQFLLSNVLAGALVFGVFQRLGGERVDLGACITQAFRRLPIILGVAMGFGLLVGMVVFVFAFAVLESFLVPIIAICSLLLIAWIFVVFLLALPAAVVEGGFASSFRRSYELTRGHRWSIFGALLLSLVVFFAISITGGIAIAFLSSSGPLVFALALLPVKVLAALFQAIVPTVIYHDLRSEKDGVGVEELRRVFS